MKKKFYCVGNAHLDPAWMWIWQEGSAEAKATVRSALDRMKEFPDFKFVCAGVSVYEWIEDFDPDMFAEIQMRVREGRFIPVGGWYVQPDCNIPSGEGFARQSLYSQRYFFEKFGVTATTGYNVDSFGHNGNLPQILLKSGMKNYIFMRPQKQEKEMESNLFYWQSRDGSQVLTYRIGECYCHKFDNEKTLLEKLRSVSEVAPSSIDVAVLFYGVGNHGGGPTVRHIKLLQEYEKKNPGSIVFSTVNDVFEEFRSQDAFSIPTFSDDLQHHASGCYSAFFPIKQAIRDSECALVAAENFSALASSLLHKDFPTEDFKKGWKNVCFIHFHDIAGGCCVKDAYKDALAFAGEALSISSKRQNSALQSISWAVDTSDRNKGTPVVVFNPHPFPVTAFAKINLRVTSVHDGQGKKLTVQHTVSQTLLCGRRTDSMIRVSIPALGYATYYINRDDAPHGVKYMAPEMRAKVDTLKNALRFPAEARVTCGKILDDDYYRVVFDTKTGCIIEWYDKKHKRQLLDGRTPKDYYSRVGGYGAVIDESDHDTWSHAKNYFNKVVGYFGNAESHVTEHGPLRVSIKFTSHYGNSTLTQTFSLANDGLLRSDVKIDWHEKQKMLKICFPLALTETSSLYEIPFGAIRRPTNGEEECGQMWCAATGKEGGVAMLNSGKYSFSVKDNKMCITGIRSPYFGDHGYAKYATEDTDVTDQGVCEFSYALTDFTSESQITKLSRIFNTPPTVIIENNHNGTLPEQKEGLVCDRENVLVSVVKRSEDGTGFVVRAYETDGKKTEATLSGCVLPKPLTAVFEPYSVETFFLADGADKWQNVLITEFPVQK